MVHSNPVNSKEEEFNDWYSKVHLPEVLNIEGFLSAQRFKLSQTQMIDDQPYNYLAIYEIDSQDIAKTLENLKTASPSLNISDSIDTNMKVSVFNPITDTLLSK